MKRALLLALLSALALTSDRAEADAVTVTLDMSQSRHMNVPLLARDRPARQRQVRARYVRLLRRAQAVCRAADKDGRRIRSPAVSARPTLLARFDRERGRLDRLLRRSKLPSAPGIRDFSQLKHIWVLRRARGRSRATRITTRRIKARVNCRFD